jgi:hypothetical protein
MHGPDHANWTPVWHKNHDYHVATTVEPPLDITPQENNIRVAATRTTTPTVDVPEDCDPAPRLHSTTGGSSLSHGGKGKQPAVEAGNLQTAPIGDKRDSTSPTCSTRGSRYAYRGGRGKGRATRPQSPRSEAHPTPRLNHSNRRNPRDNEKSNEPDSARGKGGP